MSKETRSDSLFQAINESELVTLSGGATSTNIAGDGGSIGHTIGGGGSVSGGTYKAGDGGSITYDNYENENGSDSTISTDINATFGK